MDLVPFLLMYSILANHNHNVMQLSTVFLHTGKEQSENEISSNLGTGPQETTVRRK